MAMGAFSPEKVTHPVKGPPRALPRECFPQCPAVKPIKKSQKSYSPDHCCNCCLKLPKWNKHSKVFCCLLWQLGSRKLLQLQAPGPISSEAECVPNMCTHKDSYGTHTCTWLAAQISTNTHAAHTKPQTKPMSSSCFFLSQLRVKVSEWDVPITHLGAVFAALKQLLPTAAQ